MEACREFIANKMSNERFRELLGVDPIPFWNASLRLCGYEQPNNPCRDEWTKYTWQKDGALNHEDLATAIQQAETEIERVLGHPIGKEWICERHPGENIMGNRSGMYKIKLPWATAWGGRNTRMIAEVNRTQTYSAGKIQPHIAVHHAEYQMTWETPELFPWRISINGTEYDLSPSGLNIDTSKAALQRWLNSLGLGNWYVTMQPTIEPFVNTDYNGAPIPTIEYPPGVTVDYLITYSHAECCRERISWDFDGHVINGTWIDTQSMVFADQFALDAYLDGLGLGDWGVFNCLSGDVANDPPTLLIPNKPLVFEVYGTKNITSAYVPWQPKLVINGVYYDNTALTTDAAINAFLTGLGLNLSLSNTAIYGRYIVNPDLVPIHSVIASTTEPRRLFGLIKDDFVLAPLERPFSYHLEDKDNDGYFESAIILGVDNSVQLPCEIEVYFPSRRINGHPDPLCRIRPITVKYLDENGAFEIFIPTHLLIKDELLNQRVKPYDDPFPIDLCCAVDDTACDPMGFYLEHLELWRVWHDDTLPAAILRSNAGCGAGGACRSKEDDACINGALTATQYVKPTPASYHTINIPNQTDPLEVDGWLSTPFNACKCNPSRPAVVDLHYLFDPCDEEDCHEVGCRGDICHKYERAVFMLAAARLWDLCPCGCEENRLKTYQRESGKRFQVGTYDGQAQIMSLNKATDVDLYPFGTRYGEVEAYRIIHNALRFENAIFGAVL